MHVNVKWIRRISRFWKAQEHARVLSGLNPLTTTATNGSARGKKHFGLDNKFDKIEMWKVFKK